MSQETIDSVVNSFLVEADLSDSEYFRAYAIALDGYRDLLFNVSGSPKTQSLCLSANNTAEMPSDLIHIVDVYYLNSRGEQVSIRQNDKISFQNDECCERLEQGGQQTTVDVVGQFFTNNNIDTVGSTSYGVGSHNDIASYRADFNNRLIVFDFRAIGVSDIGIEYIAAFDCCEEVVVHPYTKEALIAYIRFKYYFTKRNVDLGTKQLYKREYGLQKSKAKNMIKGVDVYQFMIESKRALRSAAKVG